MTATAASAPTATEVRLVPIEKIAVLNPRARNRRVFKELVASIQQLGLKKPITVAQRPGQDGYDLVCGQGRLEAFVALGETEISAVVVEASEEDCFVMSLVENLARRQHSPLDLMRQIGALKERGYRRHSQIVLPAGNLHPPARHAGLDRPRTLGRFAPRPVEHLACKGDRPVGARLGRRALLQLHAGGI
jgi:hypothetical protein